MMNKSLYIHIPFCNSICPYCDFHKMVASKKLIEDYLKALLEEAKLKKLDNYTFNTCYFGGGTPSIIEPKLLDRFLYELDKIIKFNNLEEFDFECNPSDLTKELLIVLKKYHVTRISIGIQSLVDSEQKFLNRIFSYDELKDKIKLLNELGFTNYNFDLIYALPNQTFDTIKYSIDKLISLKPKHFSIYALILEPHTILYHEFEKGNFKEEPDDIQACEYEFICKYLEQYGYERYEISNFAVKGSESKHNLCYWNYDDYYALGTGATAKYNQTRFVTTTKILEYIDSLNNHLLPKISEEKLSNEDYIEEIIMMNLRKIEGINKEAFYKKTNLKINTIINLDSLCEKGYLIEDELSVKINPKFFFVSNYIISTVLNTLKI